MSITNDDIWDIKMNSDNKRAPINIFENELCKFYLQIEDYKHANQIASDILEKEPDNPIALLVMGYVSETGGNLKSALFYYDELTSSHPRDVEAIKRKALVEMNLGNGKRALTDINLAIRLAGNDSETYLIRGMINLYIFRKNIDAIQDYNLSLRLNPNNKDALFQRGYAYWKYGNLNYAEDDLKRAARLGSDEAQKMLVKNFRRSVTS